jgi:hypothetical protein
MSKEVTREDILNFATAEEALDFALLPEDEYLFKVVKTETRVGNDSGNPYPSFDAVVIDDKNGGETVGRHVFGALYFVGKTPKITGDMMGRVKREYRAITGNELTAEGTAPALASAIAAGIQGQEFVGFVNVEGPRSANRIAKANGIDQVTAEQLAKTEADDWALKGWKPQNRIRRYKSADTWTSSEPKFS